METDLRELLVEAGLKSLLDLALARVARDAVDGAAEWEDALLLKLTNDSDGAEAVEHSWGSSRRSSSHAVNSERNRMHRTREHSRIMRSMQMTS